MITGVQVAVDNAALKFDRLYSYNVPEEWGQYAKTGARVSVPFGRGPIRMGIILGSCLPDDSYKYIADIEKDTPEVTQELIEIIKFLRDTTYCTYYDAVKTVLPKNVRLVPDKETGALREENSGHTEVRYEASVNPDETGITRRQKEILSTVDRPLTFGEISEITGASRETVNRMAEKGLLVKASHWKQAEFETAAYSTGALSSFSLSDAQQAAYDAISGYMDSEECPDTTLLRGVTSSGKTLIYTKLIEKTVGSGKGALLLVPEIALATQLISRIRSTFGDRVGIIHSSLSDTERTLQWKQIKDGKFDIVVGTRSAVFAPVKNPGLIIIDEEQEETYNSDQAPRYKTASVAAMRARKNGAHLLLASATPSVETYYKAEQGIINLVKLDERYGNVPLPKVTVCDMRDELMAGNTHSIGRTLYDSIKERLEKKEQIIILINRRGYRPVSICSSCKKVLMCEDCSAPMVWHKKDNVLKCHYCGKTMPLTGTCPGCKGELKHTGVGTQKVEEELAELFPEARVLRLDVDSAQAKGAMAASLKAFENHEYDIIVGTQMIAKGLDFSDVTLVGVLSIDSLLLMPSYKAYEKAFDMLTQVIGRAGRGDKLGEAVIQTIDPENPIIKLAAAQQFEAFYASEVVLRRVHLYPPYCRICAVCFTGENEKKTEDGAKAFSEIIREVFSKHPDVPLRVLGPSPMRISQINKQYRYRIILKCRWDRKFRELLRETIDKFSEDKTFGSIRVYVDPNNDSDA